MCLMPIRFYLFFHVPIYSRRAHTYIVYYINIHVEALRGIKYMVYRYIMYT